MSGWVLWKMNNRHGKWLNMLNCLSYDCWTHSLLTRSIHVLFHSSSFSLSPSTCCRFFCRKLSQIQHWRNWFWTDREQFGLHCPTQGHFDMWAAWSGDQTANPLISGWPALPPEPWPHALISMEWIWDMTHFLMKHSFTILSLSSISWCLLFQVKQILPKPPSANRAAAVKL